VKVFDSLYTLCLQFDICRVYISRILAGSAYAHHTLADTDKSHKKKHLEAAIEMRLLEINELEEYEGVKARFRDLEIGYAYEHLGELYRRYGNKGKIKETYLKAVQHLEASRLIEGKNLAQEIRRRKLKGRKG